MNKANRYLELANGIGKDSLVSKIYTDLAMLETSRLATIPTERQRLFFTLGLTVMGPLLCGFALFVSRRSRGIGVDKILCLARDGQLIQRVMTQMASGGLPFPDLQYCFASRSALRRPEYYLEGDGVPFWLFQGAGDLTLEMIFENLDMDLPSWLPWIRRHGWGDRTTNKPLRAADRQIIKNWFQEEKFRESFLEICENQFNGAVKYLTSLGLLDASHVAICDVGWKGTLQNSFQAIAQHADVKISGFYLGLEKRVERDGSTTLNSYLKGNLNGQSLIADAGFTEIIEMLLPADHAGVTGYVESDGYVEFSSKTQAMGYGSDYKIYVEGIDQCVALVKSHLELADVNMATEDDLRNQCVHGISLLTKNPNLDEARILGNMKHSIQPMHNNECVLVPDLSLMNICKLVIRKGARWVFWHAGVIRIHGYFIGGLFVSICRARKLASRLIQFFNQRAWQR